MPEEYHGDIPEFDPELITGSGTPDYNQFLMAYLGLMDAPEGRFRPTDPITEEEAALIMYIAAELANAALFEYFLDEEEIIEFFEILEAFDETGPNAFDTERRLTNRLALVRLSRFFDIVIE